ncbi:phospholipid scramblase family protein [Acrasis kona]|uniref:Phospholipid scramblase n=1 Tax=Acrasis kona TaxID=1008807 RepID=A0AAW2YKI4_9EUKA
MLRKFVRTSGGILPSLLKSNLIPVYSQNTKLIITKSTCSYTQNMGNLYRDILKKQDEVRYQKAEEAEEKKEVIQPITLKPDSLEAAEKTIVPEELRNNPIMKEDVLVVVRAMEFAQIILGFEQANKYEIKHKDTGEVIGLIAEESSLTQGILRNITHRHRSFTATIMDPNGTILFKIKRPFYVISSSMTIENAYGVVIGEIKEDWHLWRRRYDLFKEKKQFARIDMNLLSWDFELRNQQGELIGTVSKNLVGLARELFTDANMYQVRTGPGILTQGIELESTENKQIDANTTTNNKESNATTTTTAPNTSVVPTYNESEIVKSLSLDEKAITLAAAIAVDFNYFSRTSGGPGIVPFIPFMGSSDPAPTDAASGASGDVGTAAAAGMGGGAADADPSEGDWWNNNDSTRDQDDNDGDDDGGGDGDSGGFSAWDLFNDDD